MRKPQREDWKTYNDVFDQFTERTISDMIIKHVLDGLGGPISMGKEANVFTATKGKEQLAVKIYLLQTANFNKIYSYIKSDPRFSGLGRQRRKIIFAWCQREYKNLLRARENGVNVPTPRAFSNNVLVMNMIGTDNPAPRLNKQAPKNPETFLKELTTQLQRLHGAGLVHGDLSPFNILNDEERPVLIDLSHGTPLDDPNAKEYLQRDCTNVANYFKKKGVDITTEELYTTITNSQTETTRKK